ncbi:MAG: hypothetical protein ACXVBE_14470 [Bdellovibrionota bacterium]
MKLGIIFLSTIVLAGCGSDTRDRENYGDLSAAPSAIILSDPEKHMGGFGRHECLLCHNAALNIHRRPGAQINVEELNRQIRNGGESKYCLTCHGKNGTSP